MTISQKTACYLGRCNPGIKYSKGDESDVTEKSRYCLIGIFLQGSLLFVTYTIIQGIISSEMQVGN